jgi:hypothetical protein
MYYPQFRVLNMTEITSQNMHNLLPIRGAQVRDALAWSKYIGAALHRYGGKSDVLIAQHNWPVWGGERVQAHRGIHLGHVGGGNHQHRAIQIAVGVRTRPVLNHRALGDERRKGRRHLGAHHTHAGAMGRQLGCALGCHRTTANNHHQAVVKVEKHREERAAHPSSPSSGAMPLRSSSREMASTWRLTRALRAPSITM